jgi:glycosyltransferase involved in cell wall biosynthesis
MILFLEYSAGGVRGGEIYHAHFHGFIKKRYKVIPEEILPFPRKLINPVKHYLLSLNLVKEKKPDLVASDISSGIRNLLAVRWMKRNGRKSLLIIQEERLNLRWNNFLVRWLVRKAEESLVGNSDIFVVNSEFSAELARKKGAPSDAPIVIAYPGMENIVADVKVDDNNRRSSGEPFDLLFVGVCEEHKGVFYLVKALNRLKKYDIRLNIVGRYLAGDGYYRKIRRFIKKHNLENTVIFHGFIERERLLDIYRKSRLYVHPSLMEGYGMALAEAMSYGLPVVATTAGAIPELIENGVNGLLVRPGDSEDLARAILNFYEDADFREIVCANNREKVKYLFTWSDYDTKLERELIPAIEKVAGIAILDEPSVAT